MIVTINNPPSLRVAPVLSIDKTAVIDSAVVYDMTTYIENVDADTWSITFLKLFISPSESA